MEEDKELEELRKKRLMELMAARAREEERERAEAERQELLRRLLTPEARQRLANLKLARPELGALLEQQVIALAQAGRLPVPVTDDLLKRLLYSLHERRREPRIIRR